MNKISRTYKTEEINKMKLLLVDGSNLLFQMFFGMPARIINKDGKAIQGTLGFVGALLKIIRMVKPTHVAVLIDGESHNPRVDVDADYKANREDYSQVEEEDNPFSQLPDIYRALEFLGIKFAETTDCETDDWMAAYALNCDPSAEIIISSFDSDFFQLITDHVSVLRYRGDKTTIFTPDTIKEKFGISPSQYADFKALTGDPSDNLRGADKVGPKTAALLLNQFGTLEGILSCSEQIAKPSIKASIQQNAERLRQNQQLIRLTNTVRVPIPVDELCFQAPSHSTTEILKAIHLR